MTESDAPLNVKPLAAAPIVAGALLAALVVFAIVVVELRDRGVLGVAANGRPMITWVAIAAFLIEVPVSFILPKRITRAAVSALVSGKAHNTFAPQSSFTEKLLAIFLGQLITGLALLEGAGFLACVAYLLEGQLAALVMITIIAAIMLLRFPTANHIDNWLTQQADLIEELK